MTDPAPAATDVKRRIRSEIFHHLSPALANAAGLSSVAELLEWVSGSRRLSHQAITAVARKMGLVTAPSTGLDVLRDTTAAWLRRSRFTKTTIDEIGADLQSLSDFSEGRDCLSAPQLAAVAKLMLDAAFDPSTNTLRKLKPVEVKPVGVTGPPAKGRSIEEILGPGAERVGLSWSNLARAPRTVRDPLPPQAAPVWPAKPGWA